MKTPLPQLTARTLAGLLCVTVSAMPVMAQSVTQPSANLNQSQTQTNQSQQPANVTGPGATAQGQQMGRPSPNQNQPQVQQNQNQNARTPGAVGTTGLGTNGTGPSR